MAQVEPLKALHYDLERVGALRNVISPPYDVIDEDDRAELLSRSPYNIVELDLPQGDDPYATAATNLARWQREGVLVSDEEPTLWLVRQQFTGPDGSRYTRQGFLARVRIEQYGPGKIRPHERTHPGPKEDRLALMRTTKTNLSPIFSLYSDPQGATAAAFEPTLDTDPWAELTTDDGTTQQIWRVSDPAAIEQVQVALAGSELLIADGHHRYETARTYAEEIGGEGPHRYVLMYLVALEDPGLVVFPTHRLLNNLETTESQERLAEALRCDFELEEITEDELAPSGNGSVRFGYIDSHSRKPFRVTLRDPEIAHRALPDHSPAYQTLDTAVLEAVILKGALGMSDDDISHFNGLFYARSDAEALELVGNGSYHACFFMAPTPVSQIQAIAAAGEHMPPKSTFFFPKIPTGIVLNSLES